MSDDEDATIPYAFEPVLPSGILSDRQDKLPVVALLSDLMLGSRLDSLSEQTEISLTIAPDFAAAETRLGHEIVAVVLDLADPVFSFARSLALIRERAPGARVIAVYPHVRDDLRAMAQEAGCDVVMPRSAFSSNLPQILRRHGAPDDLDEPQTQFNIGSGPQ